MNTVIDQSHVKWGPTYTDDQVYDRQCITCGSPLGMLSDMQATTYNAYVRVSYREPDMCIDTLIDEAIHGG